MTVIEVPVLIVGGGPAGLAMSLLLSAQGVGSLLVEQRATPSLLPRARGVHARTMEILRTCGAEQAVRESTLTLASGAEWRQTLADPPSREQVTGGPTLSEVSPCEGAAIAQDTFDAVLRAEAADRPAASVRFGTTAGSLTVRTDGVQAVLRDNDGSTTRVRARYLVAADGAHSQIREQLGIALSGHDDLGRQRAISFRANLTRWVGVVPRGIYFLTARRAVLLRTHPDDRWILHQPEPTDGDAPDIVRAALGLPDLGLEILTEGRWTAVARTAQRFAAGPVFLVGDAAHQAPPAGATGISTAMADVHNLAWKLAAVLQGRAGDALLSTYRAEREPVAARVVEEAVRAWETTRNTEAVPFSGRSLRMIDMGYRYTSTAVLDDGSPDPDEPSEYAPTAVPGCRAPHLWIEADHADGPRSILDLFGRDLVLLTGPAGAAWRAAAPDSVVAHCIDEPQWAALYDVGPAGAVLVRPDGHVAWRSPEPGPAKALATAVHAVLAT